MTVRAQHTYRSAPIIFCHFGNSPYLPYVFACATLSNPGKQIVLLGDESNRRTAERFGLVHVPFAAIPQGEATATFEHVYRRVTGPKCGHLRDGTDWIKFVFKRWFHVYDFLSRNKIRSFWHFDSDNMLLDDLSVHESRLATYDCTEQCNGCCMNGYMANCDVLGRYLSKINELFQRKELLDTMSREFHDVHLTYAFTEMRAYKIFKQEDHLRTFHLNAVTDGTAFDDCICQEHGMEMERLYFGKHIKKVFLSDNGQFHCRSLSDHTFVRMASLNLSWVPIFVFDNVLRHRQQRTSTGKTCVPHEFSGNAHTLASSPLSWSYLLKDGPREVWRYGLTHAVYPIREQYLAKKADVFRMSARKPAE